MQAPRAGDLARFLGLKQFIPDDELIVVRPERRATIVDDKGKPWEYRSPLQSDIRYEGPVRSSRPGAPIRRAYMTRDSFGKALMPYVAESFESAVFRWTANLEPEAVREVAPDVVIIELVERRLMSPPRQLTADR
jgi:hypothetical protein